MVLLEEQHCQLLVSCDSTIWQVSMFKERPFFRPEFGIFAEVCAHEDIYLKTIKQARRLANDSHRMFYR